MADGGGRLLRQRSGHSEPPIKVRFHGNDGQVLLSAGMKLVFSARQHAERAICYRPSVRLSVRLSVCRSVRHTGGSVENG